MEFEYFYETRINASIDIENINNCAIAAFNDFGMQYILIITTKLGQTKVLEFGPLSVNSDKINSACDIRYNIFDTDDKKIKKIISYFLNEAKREITQAIEFPVTDAVGLYPNLLECVKDG